MVRISFKKQREIGFSPVSLTGGVKSEKNDAIIDFESSLERDFIIKIEYDHNVVRYCEQPIKIYYDDKYYVPDFYVELKNGKKKLIEIKYIEDLKENKSVYKRKFKAAAEFCFQNGLEFLILSEIDIRDYKLYNAKFFLNYKSKKNIIPFGDLKIIRSVFWSEGDLSVSKLIELSAVSKERRGQLLYVLWWMIANDYVYFNNNSKIGMDTILSLSKL